MFFQLIFFYNKWPLMFSLFKFIWSYYFGCTPMLFIKGSSGLTQLTSREHGLWTKYLCSAASGLTHYALTYSSWSSLCNGQEYTFRNQLSGYECQLCPLCPVGPRSSYFLDLALLGLKATRIVRSASSYFRADSVMYGLL